MFFKELVLFSAPLWLVVLAIALVTVVVIMTVLYIRRLEKSRSEEVAAAIRMGLLLQQNRDLLGKVRNHISECHRCIADLETNKHDMTLKLCELRSRVSYYETASVDPKTRSAQERYDLGTLR